MSPRIGSLFSGYGGLDMAVRSVLGGGLAWYSEIDPGACRVLAHHHEGVPNLGDVTAVDWTAVEPVDVLTGGFPCQDLSPAGARAGLRPDTRSGLWTHMAHAIAVLRPRLVVIENVRGLLSGEAHSDLEPCPWCLGDGHGVPLRAHGAVLGDLADLGYDARWRGLHASDAGAPHSRFRVFVVAVRTAAHPDRPGRQGAQPAQRHHVPARGAVADSDDLGRQRTRHARHGSGGPADHGGAAAHTAGPRRGRAGNLAPGAAPDAEPETGQRTTGRGGGPPAVAWGDYAPAIRRWERLLGRPAPAPVVWSGTYRRMRQLRLARRHPKPAGMRGSLAPRHVLAPAFVEWLMGLPPGWVTDVPGLTRAQMLRILGNGVVPHQATAALHHLLDHNQPTRRTA